MKRPFAGGRGSGEQNHQQRFTLHVRSPSCDGWHSCARSAIWTRPSPLCCIQESDPPCGWWSGFWDPQGQSLCHGRTDLTGQGTDLSHSAKIRGNSTIGNPHVPVQSTSLLGRPLPLIWSPKAALPFPILFELRRVPRPKAVACRGRGAIAGEQVAAASVRPSSPLKNNPQ